MATTRLMPLHTGKGRTVGAAIRDIINYVANPEKTDHSQLITSYQCDSRMADAEFLFSKKLYAQKTGRTRGRDNVIAYHLRQSFSPGEITPQEANRLGRELAFRFTKGNHAFIVCTHIDKAHIHNHIIWNSTSLDHTRKFRDFRRSAMAVHRLNDTICVENGYSVVPASARTGKSYNKWLGDNARLSHRERLRLAIDEALEQKPQSFDVLLSILREMGYEIKDGNNPSFRGEGQKRFIRMDTLGAEYSAADLRAVVAGKRVHKPRKPQIQKAKQTNQLLIDIQAKLCEGKGVGYERWAKKFNLKQMARTIAFLQEHQLLNYATLSEKASAASERYSRLSAEIRDAEKRMTEIQIMRTQIINYAKTRETYTAYRKAGYSKQFLSEHESDILLHKAAKRYFDKQGLERLPSVRSLQEEYADLMARKKTAYTDYHTARSEMKEMLTAKANVDQILGEEPSRKSEQKEKDGSARS